MPCNRSVSDAVRTPTRNGLIARLMSLSDDLREKDIEGIKFLCRDFNPGSRLENCWRGTEIFEYLIDTGLITDENIDILVECLSRINKPDWIRNLYFKPDDVKLKVSRESKLKPFRVMLFNISEDISVEDVSKIQFYLQNIIPGHQNRNISSCTTMVEAFTLCEKMGILDERNFEIIYDMLKYIHRDDLLDEVDVYAEKAGFINSPACEPMNISESPQRLGPRNTYESSPSYRPMDISESPQRLGPRNAYESSPSYRPMNISECPSSHNITQWSPLCKSIDNIVPDHVTVPPCLHGNDTMFPHAQFRRIPNSGLSVAPLTLDVISEFSFIPNVSYEFYTARANSSSCTSQNLYDQFGYETVSTSEPELAGRRATTKAGFVAEREATTEAGFVAGKRATTKAGFVAEREATTEAGFVARREATTEAGFVAGREATTEAGFVAGKRATTEAGFVTEFPKAMPHPSSPLVPLGGAIRQSQEQLESLNCYKMDALPRGRCLIINNKNFYKVENDEDSTDLEYREGTDKDCEKLQNLFRNFHFVVEVKHDQTDLEMYQLMSTMTKKVDHSCYDCFVCCVLSHGSEGNVFGSNGKEVPIINLTGFFLSSNCPSLAGKPKVFFFQACQGSKKQSGYRVEQDAADIVTDAPAGRVIPNEADFLLGFATVAGYASFRNTVTGTWYISTLVQMLERYHEREDVLSILVRVNGEVCEESTEDDSRVYKQTPAPTLTLTKKLYF